jgi:DNA polymerase eta
MARSKQAAFPFARNLTLETVYGLAEKLWKEMLGTDETAPPDMKFTHVGLAFGGVAAMDAAQSGIEGFFKGASTHDDDAGDLLEKCSRCGAAIRLQPGADPTDLDARSRAMIEHDDWHFARDLAKQPGSSPEPPSPPPVTTAKRKASSPHQGQPTKKRKAAPKGIAKYFTKK